MKARYALIKPQVNTAGLVGWWKFHDGTALDYSGNNYNGTVSGTTYFYTFPGLDLAGVNEHVTIADQTAFTPAGTPLTITAWVNMDDATNFRGIANKGVYNTDGEWYFYTTGSDKVTVEIYDESVANCYIGRIYDTAITSYENIWTHFAMTYSGGTTSAACKIYMNGVRVDDADNESQPASFVAVEDLASNVYLGSYSVARANGQIDDVMIFTVEKSATEIKSIYEVTRQRYGV